MKKLNWCGLLLWMTTVLIACAGGESKTEGKNAPEGTTAFSEEVAVMYGGAQTEIDGGFLMRVGGLMVCYDVSSRKLIPFCTRPDCDHEVILSGQEICPAAILGDSAMGICVYKGRIWYLKGVNGKEVILGSADLTGENAKELYYLDAGSSVGNQAVVYQDKLYKVDEQFSYDEYGMYEGIRIRLVCIDLSNGALTEIERLETDQLSYEIIGIRDGKLYYRYYPGTIKYPDGAVVYYDCETGEKGEVKLADCRIFIVRMNQDYLVYRGETGKEAFLAVVDLATGEEKDRFPVNGSIAYQVFENEVLVYAVESGYYRYTFETGEYEEIKNKEVFKSFEAFWNTGDGYLGMKIEDGVATEYAYMDRESFDYGGEIVLLTEKGRPIW